MTAETCFDPTAVPHTTKHVLCYIAFQLPHVAGMPRKMKSSSRCDHSGIPLTFLHKGSNDVTTLLLNLLNTSFKFALFLSVNDVSYLFTTLNGLIQETFNYRSIDRNASAFRATERPVW